jgi:hypothetical protein
MGLWLSISHDGDATNQIACTDQDVIAVTFVEGKEMAARLGLG